MILIFWSQIFCFIFVKLDKYLNLIFKLSKINACPSTQQIVAESACSPRGK